MPPHARLRALLASCRRVVLLLLLALALAGLWAAYNAPSLDSLRPQIESQLRDRLDLARLELGPLSWHWAGTTWIRTERISLATRSGDIRLDGAALSIRIDTLDLLAGKLSPAGVRVTGGALTVTADGKLLRPGHLDATLENVDVRWRRGALSGEIDRLNLHYDGGGRTLQIHLPTASLELTFDAEMRPRRAALDFSDLDWLPPQWRRQVEGELAGELDASYAPGDGSWRLDGNLRGRDGALLRPGGDLPLSSLDLRLSGEGATNDLFAAVRHPTRVTLQQFAWRGKRSRLRLSGRWEAGELALRLHSGRLFLPRLWRALRPFGDARWRGWLGEMRGGMADALRGDFTAAWSHPWRRPEELRREQLRFDLEADVRGADFALAIDGGRLTGTNGHVRLTEEGLRAEVDATTFPESAGSGSGRFAIPDWETMLMEIDGRAAVDLPNLLAWIEEEGLSQLKIDSGRAEGEVHLAWHPDDDAPRAGEATLTPADTWRARLFEAPLTLDGGRVRWHRRRGVEVEAMHFASQRFSGRLALTAARDDAGEWTASELRADAEAALADVVRAYRIPAADAAGPIHADIRLEGGRLTSRLDLKGAGWKNLLGSAKEPGTACAIDLRGRMAEDSLRIDRIESEAGPLRIRGDGRVDTGEIVLSLGRLESALFRGEMRLRAPVGPEPVEIDLRADHLARRALPGRLPEAGEHAKPWALRAQIDRFDWDAATMHGVALNLASSGTSAGSFAAERIESPLMQLHDAKALFGLPGDGVIDLRQFTSRLDGQKLALSATLTDEPGGGVRWRGFARLDGNFGDLMKRAELSDRFVGGSLHSLLSGEGVLLRGEPWWRGIEGRLRLRADDGRVLEGGPLSRLLAAASLADLPKLLVGQRKDLVGKGIHYRRLQLEARIRDETIDIDRIAMRASALDMAGRGKLNVDTNHMRLTLVMRPLQNLDAILGAIPLLRDILGGAARSLVRKVYRVEGAFADAEAREITPEEAGLAAPGLIESLLRLPARWFGSSPEAP